MINSSFGGSRRTTVPSEAWDMGQVLSELLLDSRKTEHASQKPSEENQEGTTAPIPRGSSKRSVKGPEPRFRSVFLAARAGCSSQVSSQTRLAKCKLPGGSTLSAEDFFTDDKRLRHVHVRQATLLPES